MKFSNVTVTSPERLVPKGYVVAQMAFSAFPCLLTCCLDIGAMKKPEGAVHVCLMIYSTKA